jgi:hypothetical protein
MALAPWNPSGCLGKHRKLEIEACMAGRSRGRFRKAMSLLQSGCSARWVPPHPTQRAQVQREAITFV